MNIYFQTLLNMCVFMVFGLWSSSSHTPIKYRCAVKKSYQVPHACLNGGFRGYAWVPNIDGTKIVRQLQIDQTKLRISWMKSTIKGNRPVIFFFHYGGNELRASKCIQNECLDECLWMRLIQIWVSMVLECQ